MDEYWCDWKGLFSKETVAIEVTVESLGLIKVTWDVGFFFLRCKSKIHFNFQGKYELQ